MHMKKSKRNGAAQSDENGDTQDEASPMQHYELPEGYKEKSSDITGFWNQANGPVHFVPRFARVFDSKLDPLKHSVIIMGEAVGPMTLLSKEHDDVECKAGDIIGVWYKPGMNAIKDLADVSVFMYPSGVKATGKPNDMVTYTIAHKKDGNPLLITDDYRKKSSHTTLPFALKNKPKASKAEDDDENFDGVNPE